MKLVVLVMMAVVSSAAPTNAGQAPTDDPVATARIHAGVVGLGPKLAVSNIGVDQNVFNETFNPKSDFTMTVSPGLDLWLRTGRGLLSADGKLDMIYFAQYVNQRSINSEASGQYEFRFNRIRPLASFKVLDAKERPGFEIDSRVRRFEDTLLAGLDVRLASKSFFQLDFRQEKTVYADDASFGGQPLNQSLNRKLKVVEGTYRQHLTALTTWSLLASSEQERFEFTTERNSNSGRVSTGVELGRRALIRGRAFVGFRSLAPAEGGQIPSYRGLTSNVDVSYTAPSQTRISGQVNRDIEYSWDLSNPYYVLTDITASLTQRIVGRWDFQATGERARLAYQTTRLPSGNGRTDFVDRVGGGIGYQVAENTRFSVDANAIHRTSIVPGNNYRTFRFGASISYGY